MTRNRWGIWIVAKIRASLTLALGPLLLLLLGTGSSGSHVDD